MKLEFRPVSVRRTNPQLPLESSDQIGDYIQLMTVLYTVEIGDIHKVIVVVVVVGIIIIIIIIIIAIIIIIIHLTD
jgi:hypothetical protein